MSDISIVSSRINEIQTQKQTVFQQPQQLFRQIYEEKLGTEYTAGSVNETSDQSYGTTGGVTAGGSSGLGSVFGSLFGDSDSSGTGVDMSSLMSTMMMTSMLSGLGGSSSSSGMSDMSSMIMMYMMMDRLAGGGSSSDQNLCTTCKQALDSYNNSTITDITNLPDKFKGAAPYMSYINAAAKKYDLPVNLILGVMKVESDFNNNSTSHAGALGLMQLMPGTAEYIGVSDPMDPAQNIDGGAKYLRMMLDQFDGDLRVALAAYNTGPGNVKKHGSTFEGQTKGVQGYVNKVLGYAGISIA